jgi:hypothetical protein
MTTLRLTQQFLAKYKMAVIPHPPYSPVLVPCDFFLFPKMKLKLKGRRFDILEEIQAESQRVLGTLTEKDFQEAFQKLRRRWNRCLHAGGNYFEGYGEFYDFYSFCPEYFGYHLVISILILPFHIWLSTEMIYIPLSFII